MKTRFLHQFYCKHCGAHKHGTKEEVKVFKESHRGKFLNRKKCKLKETKHKKGYVYLERE